MAKLRWNRRFVPESRPEGGEAFPQGIRVPGPQVYRKPAPVKRWAQMTPEEQEQVKKDLGLK